MEKRGAVPREGLIVEGGEGSGEGAVVVRETQGVVVLLVVLLRTIKAPIITLSITSNSTTKSIFSKKSTSIISNLKTIPPTSPLSKRIVREGRRGVERVILEGIAKERGGMERLARGMEEGRGGRRTLEMAFEKGTVRIGADRPRKIVIISSGDGEERDTISRDFVFEGDDGGGGEVGRGRRETVDFNFGEGSKVGEGFLLLV